MNNEVIGLVFMVKTVLVVPGSRCWFMPGIVGLCLATINFSTLAQLVNQRELSTGYAHLVSFAAEPEIAAATFDIDDERDGGENLELATQKFPLYKEFDSDAHDWHWFAQGALTHMTFKEDLNLSPAESIRFKWEGFGGLIEGGIIVPLNHAFSFAPSLGIGVQYLENDARFSSSDLEDLLKPGLDGIVYNWDSLATIARVNLGLLYDEKFGNYRFKGNAHLTYADVNSRNESRGFQGFSGHASSLSVKLDVSHPLNISVRDHPLHIIGHLGNTSFLGSGRDVLGFSSFSEIGASLGISRFAMGAMAIKGDGVEGWTVTLNYDY